MPLLVVTGYPSSGKSTFSKKIKIKFQTIGYNNVVIVDDHLCTSNNVYKKPLIIFLIFKNNFKNLGKRKTKYIKISYSKIFIKRLFSYC